MCLSDFIYDIYYLSRKKQIILIICAVLVVCLLVGAVCFYVHMAIRINTPDYEPDIVVSSPDGQYELVIREEKLLLYTRAEIYIRRLGQDDNWKEQRIGITKTYDYYCPFAEGKYNVEWKNDKVTIYYFTASKDGEDVNDQSTWRGVLCYEFE